MEERGNIFKKLQKVKDTEPVRNCSFGKTSATTRTAHPLPQKFVWHVAQVSETVEQPNYWVLLLATTVVGFLPLLGPPRVLFTNRGKVIDGRDANPRTEGYALARRNESESHGFDVSTGN